MEINNIDNGLNNAKIDPAVGISIAQVLQGSEYNFYVTQVAPGASLTPHCVLKGNLNRCILLP